MSGWEIVIGVLLGLAVNEACDLSPWLARKLVQWSARFKYGKSERAEVRAEELSAMIDSRPGKLLKLATGLIFSVSALVGWGKSRFVGSLMMIRMSDRLYMNNDKFAHGVGWKVSRENLRRIYRDPRFDHLDS
ncbi:hypothetical protein [Streptosporangium sp. DT93]|uniref:hypothetical protein n=1 Tax=Streptosporangium sp. DT93 TaxID=3393428 RepID=UPI003CE729D2